MRVHRVVDITTPCTRTATVLAALTLLVAACGGEDRRAPAETGEAPTSTAPAGPSTTSTTAAPAAVDGMVASIDVSRLFVLQHAMGLGLQNLGTAPRTVVQIQIESALFETVPPADERVVLTPGLRELVMPVPYGAPRCDEPEPDPSFTAVVRFDDGTELRIPAPPRAEGTIERLHARECAAVDLLDRVEVTFGDDWVPDGLAVHGELRLRQRHPGPPVAFSELSGSVIFTVTAEDPLGALAVDDDRPEAAIPITIDTSRCDPHGLSEAKRAYVFVGWLRVDGGESVAIDLPLDGAVRTALEGRLAACLAQGGVEAEVPG